MTNDILQKHFYNHKPEVVWKFLTDPELLKGWLMETSFKPEVGYDFMFNTKPKVKVGFDGNVYCKVLEVVPNKRLSYSWKGGPKPGVITLDSVVVWTLEEKNNGTELTLEHKGFKGFKNYLSYIIMNQGWKKILKRLNSKIII